MKQLYWIIILWYMNISPTTPFYHEISTVKPYDPLREDAYFGYSMAFLDKDLVISAPRADDIGQIYNYDTKTDDLSRINLELKREVEQFKHDYWLGATVTTGSSFFVTCAPRVVENSTYTRDWFTAGTCYNFTSKTYIKLEPKNRNTGLFNGNSDSFGWSINVDPLNSIMIGGPALIGGYVKIHQTQPAAPHILINTTNTYNFGYSIASGFFLSEKEITFAVSSTYGTYGEGQVFIFSTDFKEKYRIINKGIGSMYGAVLCALRLEGNRSSLLVGAPTYTTNSHEYDQGAIYLYVPNYYANATECEGKYRADTRMFQTFCHMFNPHLSSVIPIAPNPLNGRVTFAQRNASSHVLFKMLVLKRIIKGTSSGGYFGYSIVNIGDLDGDGKDEIAIGAPYEDAGKGAVYIYSGHGLLFGKTWLQKINRSDFRSFGFSLAALTESYENVCNGLAISAPLDNRVFLYKCTAYITVNLRTKFPNLQKRENQRYFEFDACIDFSYPDEPKLIDSEIDFKVKITHTYAKLDNSAPDGSITNRMNFRERRESICYSYKVLTPEEGDYNEMIKYNITVDLTDRMMKKTKEKFDRAHVLLSDRSVRSLEGELWAANCNITYGRCVPRLSLKSFTTLTDPYIVNSSKIEKFSLMISNSGEIAYNLCVMVTVVGAHVLSYPPACTRGEDAELVICKPNKILPSGYKWSANNIEIDTSFATNQLDTIMIQTDLYNNCNDKTDTKTEQQFFGLIYDFSGIRIQGLSNPSKILNITTVDVTLGKQFHHLYSIKNDGSTDYLNARFKIVLEKRKYLSYSLEVSPKSKITVMNETQSMIEYTYNVKQLARRNETNVYLCINIVPETLGEFITSGNVTILSHLTLYLKDDIQEMSVSTTLVFKSTRVAAWIIIIAILMGLLILLLMAFILREILNSSMQRSHKLDIILGCFQRKNKKKLNSLKELVRTQSMHQNSRGHQILQEERDTNFR